MKKVLALSLVLSVSFVAANNLPKKSENVLSEDTSKTTVNHAPKAEAEEAFDPEALDDALEQDLDTLESNDKTDEPTIISRYVMQPMTRLGIKTYCALPDRVQLALLAAYLYAEETYESFADFIQEKYRSIRGLDEDDQDEVDDEEDTLEETNEVDSEQDA